MNERRFPTEEEVNTWLADRHAASHGSVAKVDQVEAAAEETLTRTKKAARIGLNLGLDASIHIGEESTNPLIVRLAARMLLTAKSAGVTPFCPHVDQVRPLYILCDPPSIVCTDCIATAAERMVGQPFRWEGQCDACGSRDALGHVMVNLDHMIIGGNVCAQCNPHFKT